MNLLAIASDLAAPQKITRHCFVRLWDGLVGIGPSKLARNTISSPDFRASMLSMSKFTVLAFHGCTGKDHAGVHQHGRADGLQQKDAEHPFQHARHDENHQVVTSC
jgi:hypothetical protein